MVPRKRRIGNQVKILNEPITVNGFASADATGNGKAQKQRNLSQETCHQLNQYETTVKFRLSIEIVGAFFA
jgi:hypothetical protein